VAKLLRLSKSRRDASANSEADSFGPKVRDLIRTLTEVQPRDPPKEKSLQENLLATPASRARDSARARLSERFIRSRKAALAWAPASSFALLS